MGVGVGVFEFCLLCRPSVLKGRLVSRELWKRMIVVNITDSIQLMFPAHSLPLGNTSPSIELGINYVPLGARFVISVTTVGRP